MLHYFLTPFKDSFSLLNLFEYITFRAASAAILALIINFIVGPWVIHILQKNQIGEEIRPTGPESHMKKRGTPTMGGVIILMAVLLPTLLFAKLDSPLIQIIIISTIWMGIIGFLDDYLKVIRKMEKGLIARYKMAGQIALGSIVSIWIMMTPEFAEFSTKTTVPFLKNIEIDLGMLYPMMVILVITGTSNAVNLTDGLDGLAAGLLAISFSVFAAIAYISGRVDFSDYLNIIYLPGAGELTIFSSAMAGACIGYLWFNSSPAEVFMGDTGSLSTGAALGTLAVLLKKELLLFIIGGVFVWEAISVIIQVLYFRWTKSTTGEGKRFFKMAPIHHHFELAGWPETKIVVRFWIIGLLFALFSLTTFKIR
ncbi:MAG: phospho-N-acetylmuramoyl-pentapeptide-transferase [Candidatus Marinimicrobia bacterium]|jgi:phospho-N-acetylmuramoyl-pentapeptide-transferase|nr:phospho-N-acetylmuramoyl-pentapeptide-transferase [Candidatus Neomarinimicrobiota bacterium]MBT3501526.1 phospho-N-acetylmuramoyl-pentapeptide-transferase [Candidatus Neomarinimicrobiota bacterium]MBT3840204.1 phospho-N-acetylmuramoyl-pentapeptide-transferase [Candidatus Neomarinimicrobiota bacterium]MBT3999872.1 phospho-N-acetylmuramoyl-pentapeptide-transferase [Candidatus Neomarinimicrobiota bacterium]MBT4282931.1 phospho-N-acetylmuramoyl-pentapeptide-transferase [Candidatus Neomarinimicro